METYITFPIHRPANFFDIRIGAQLSLRARYDRKVQPSSQSVNAPVSKSITSWLANVSSSPDHFPDLWRLSSSSDDEVRSEPAAVSSSGMLPYDLFLLERLMVTGLICLY